MRSSRTRGAGIKEFFRYFVHRGFLGPLVLGLVISTLVPHEGPMWVFIISASVGCIVVAGMAFFVRRREMRSEVPSAASPVNHGLAEFPSSLGRPGKEPVLGVFTNGKNSRQHFAAGAIDEGDRCSVWVTRANWLKPWESREFDSVGEMRTWLRPQGPIFVRPGECRDRAFLKYFSL